VSADLEARDAGQAGKEQDRAPIIAAMRPALGIRTSDREQPYMTMLRLIMLSAAAMAISASSSHARPCPLQIDAWLAARAVAGVSAPQSVGAMMHHQPTAGSVAAAEARLAVAAYGMRPGLMYKRTAARFPVRMRAVR